MTGAPDGAPFADLWARSTDGLRLHARVYGDGAPGLPVICLPGLTRTASEFHGLATWLIREGFRGRILAIDYRGRGRSDHDPDPGRYAIPVETADLLTMLGEVGIARAAFVGVSRGGLIAMGLAAARPEVVAGLVLNDIGPVIERDGLLRIKGYVGRLGSPLDRAEAGALLKARFGAFFPAFDDGDWRGWADTVWTERDGALVADYDPALARTLDGLDEATPIPDLWPVFDAIGRVPLLVIRGGLSDILSAGTVAEMRRRRPDLEAMEVAGEGHTPLLHRPAVARRIAALIRRAGGETPRRSAAG